MDTKAIIICVYSEKEGPGKWHIYRPLPPLSVLTADTSPHVPAAPGGRGKLAALRGAQAHKGLWSDVGRTGRRIYVAGLVANYRNDALVLAAKSQQEEKPTLSCCRENTCLGRPVCPGPLTGGLLPLHQQLCLYTPCAEMPGFSMYVSEKTRTQRKQLFSTCPVHVLRSHFVFCILHTLCRFLHRKKICTLAEHVQKVSCLHMVWTRPNRELLGTMETRKHYYLCTGLWKQNYNPRFLTPQETALQVE